MRPLGSFLFALLLSTPFLGEAVDFESEILPVLEAKCVECHKAPYEENGRTKKPKAGLRLDAAWAILAGSEDGAVLVPKDADKSSLFARVTLPEDDDDFMPPVGKADPLTKQEIKSLRKWINEGADFGDWEGNLEGKPKVTKKEDEAPPVSEVQLTYEKLASKLPKIEEDAWKEVTAAGGRVARLSSQSPLLSVDYRLVKDDATDKSLVPLQSIAPHIAHLDLSQTSISDAGLSVLQQSPNLVRLNLSQTAIGDEAMGNLKGLAELRYLNLYGSQVSDNGLQVLHSLKNLEAVYLWQSKATPAGAKSLEKALPDARIILK
ncbi:MAG: hypothetical protein P1U85_10835 [Verrucomicrobiales bacterium]|nr:hypothetical protein [Verrucomicrobiales bacterium]